MITILWCIMGISDSFYFQTLSTSFQWSTATLLHSSRAWQQSASTTWKAKSEHSTSESSTKEIAQQFTQKYKGICKNCGKQGHNVQIENKHKQNECNQDKWKVIKSYNYNWRIYQFCRLCFSSFAILSPGFHSTRCSNNDFEWSR